MANPRRSRALGPEKLKNASPRETPSALYTKLTLSSDSTPQFCAGDRDRERECATSERDRLTTKPSTSALSDLEKLNDIAFCHRRCEVAELHVAFLQRHLKGYTWQGRMLGEFFIFLASVHPPTSPSTIHLFLVDGGDEDGGDSRICLYERGERRVEGREPRDPSRQGRHAVQACRWRQG